MASRTPPKFVPTLTEVVQHSGPAPLSPTPAVSPVAPVSQEQIAQKVMQRVDLVLDRRVREAIATVVLEQTDLLAPMLRERLETLVREVVAEAVAQEMQERGRPGR